MVTIDRASIDLHLLATGYLPQQLSATVPNIAAQYRIAVLRRPDQVILTIPDCMATMFVILHMLSIALTPLIRRLKARDLLIPYGGL